MALPETWLCWPLAAKTTMTGIAANWWAQGPGVHKAGRRPNPSYSLTFLRQLPVFFSSDLRLTASTLDSTMVLTRQVSRLHRVQNSRHLRSARLVSVVHRRKVAAIALSGQGKHVGDTLGRYTWREKRTTRERVMFNPEAPWESWVRHSHHMIGTSPAADVDQKNDERKTSIQLRKTSVPLRH